MTIKKRLRLEDLNPALQELGLPFDTQLKQGCGCVYWSGPDCENWVTAVVESCGARDKTVGQWWCAYHQMKSNSWETSRKKKKKK